MGWGTLGMVDQYRLNMGRQPIVKCHHSIIGMRWLWRKNVRKIESGQIRTWLLFMCLTDCYSQNQFSCNTCSVSYSSCGLFWISERLVTLVWLYVHWSWRIDWLVAITCISRCEYNKKLRYRTEPEPRMIHLQFFIYFFRDCREYLGRGQPEPAG